MSSRNEVLEATRNDFDCVSISRRAFLGAAFGAALFGWGAGALAQDKSAVLTLGMAATISSIDPHFQNSTPNNSLATAIFDRLVERTADAKLVPGLAVSWRPVEPKIWEFKLRPNVRWHDGAPFTADDVAFTLDRIPKVPNSPSRYDGYLRAVERVEIVDPLTLRIHTKDVAPLLPNNLNNVSIVSRHVGESAATSSYNSGEGAVGTGPYKFVRYIPNDRVELARNDAWWGGPQPWERITVRFLPNAGARTAALLSGSVDVIDAVPSNDIARLKATPNIAVYPVGGFRTVFLMFNYTLENGGEWLFDKDGKPLPQNPLKDIRVRRALSLAIDRKALAERVMLGTVEPAGQFLPAGATAYAEGIDAPRVDVAAAKKLLAEAGYPEGFQAVLHTPQDRYPNDTIMAQAVAQMWTRAGIRTTVNSIPNATYNKTTTQQQFGLGVSGYGNARGDPSDILVNSISSWDRTKGSGANNHGRYSNPKLDALVANALSILDDAERNRKLAEAVAMAMTDVAVIPLYNQSWAWAGRKGFRYEPRKDGFTTVKAITPEK